MRLIFLLILQYPSFPNPFYHTTIRAIELPLSIRHILTKLSMINLIILQLEFTIALLKIMPEISFKLFQMLVNFSQIFEVVRWVHVNEVWIRKFTFSIEVAMEPLTFVCNFTVWVVEYSVSVALSFVICLAHVT